MPIFVFLGLSLLRDARQRVWRQGFDFRPFPAARPEKSAAAVRRSRSASLRPSPTNYEARARAHCMSQLKAHFGLLVSYRPLAMIFLHLEQGR